MQAKLLLDKTWGVMCCWGESSVGNVGYEIPYVLIGILLQEDVENGFCNIWKKTHY